MVHGVYLKNRPKSKWHLVSVASSIEKAQKEVDLYLQQAKLEGFDNAEVAIQAFDSSFYIPEYLSSVKEQKPMLN
jgi:hypothetical protein